MTDEKIFNPFPGDSYDTPEDTKRALGDRLLLGSRFSFYFRNFYIFAKSGKEARHESFTGEPQTRNSLENFRLVEKCGGRIHLSGLNNIDSANRSAVIIGNHMSLLETAVMHAFLRPRTDFCFVIKKSLLDVPFFGNIMRRLDCIAVSRTNPRDDFKTVMEEGKKQLDANRSVVVFPQSTRSAVFDESLFNTIGVKLARYANAPIIPMALRTDFLESGKLIKDMGPVRRERPVHFTFGEVIRNVSGSGREEQQKIVDFIKGNLREWGCQIKESASNE